MAIKFKCGCGHVLSVPDKFAGKNGKCPKCQKVLKVPTPKVGVASPAQPAARPAPVAPAGQLDSLFDEVGLTQKSGPICPSCAAEIKPGTVVCVACGTNLQTGEKMLGFNAQTTVAEFDNLYLQEAAENMRRDLIMESRREKAAMPWWVLMSFLIGTITLCAAGIVIVDGIFGEGGNPDTLMGRIQMLPVPAVLGTTVGVTGLAIALFAHLSISLFAFGKNAWHGVGCLFGPAIVSIPYGIMNWTENKAPVKALIVAMLFIGLALFMILMWGGGFSRLLNVL
ncbi:MAG: hypothetical protein R3C53_18440 [Pirellulaceae bacterium]